jgi:hypothetical protein
LVDVRLDDWRTRVESVLEEVTALVATLGGTLTGEHGDGRLRTPLLQHVWDNTVRERFALVKRSFDPTGILNPGVKVPAGEQSLGAIKYDPMLPPLPPASRAVLEVVERERTYDRFRLDLLEPNG